MSGDSPGLPETENPISCPLLLISDCELISVDIANIHTRKYSFKMTLSHK